MARFSFCNRVRIGPLRAPDRIPRASAGLVTRPRPGPGRSLPLPVLLGSLSAALLGLLASCSTPPPIETTPPPPPSADQREAGPPPKYDYEHAVVPAREPRERRPVVALLRADDIAELADALPFGRTKPEEIEEEGKVKRLEVDVLPFGRTEIVEIEQEGKVKHVEVRGKHDYPVEMYRDVRQYLMRELVNSNEVIVVERERILEILREQQFWNTKHVHQETAPKTGRLIGVHYIIEGAFFPRGSGPAAESVWAELDEITIGRSRRVDASRMAAMYLSVYDTETGVVTAVAYGADENHAVAVRNAVDDLLDKLADMPVPIRVVSFDEEGNAYLDIGAKAGVKEGDEFVGRSPTGDEVRLAAWKVDPLTCLVKFLEGGPSDLALGAEVRRKTSAKPNIDDEPEG